MQCANYLHTLCAAYWEFNNIILYEKSLYCCKVINWYQCCYRKLIIFNSAFPSLWIVKFKECLILCLVRESWFSHVKFWEALNDLRSTSWQLKMFVYNIEIPTNHHTKESTSTLRLVQVEPLWVNYNYKHYNTRCFSDCSLQ